MADPNWLLSTTAQSAAALVAIIGGFLVSRVIALSSERQGLVRRAAELDEVHQQLTEEHDEAHADALHFAGNDLIDSIAAQLVDDDVDLEVLVTSNLPSGFDTDDLMAVAKHAHGLVAVARRDIEAAYEGQPDVWASDLREVGVDIEDTFIADEVYEAVARHIVEERRRPRTGWEVGIVPMLPNPTYGTSQIMSDNAAQKQDDRVRRRDDLRSRIRSLETERRVVQRDLERITGSIPTLRTGTTVLVYFAVVGIVVPLASIALRPVPTGPWFRGLIVALFISGLGALLWYLIRAVNELRTDSTSSTWAQCSRETGHVRVADVAKAAALEPLAPAAGDSP